MKMRFALRAVSSTDGMTADWCHLPRFLAKVSNDIINQVKGINRVTYDIVQNHRLLLNGNNWNDFYRLLLVVTLYYDKFFFLITFVFVVHLFSSQTIELEKINGKIFIHLVEKGNTLYQLKKIYGVNQKDILDANPNLHSINYRTTPINPC